MGRNLMVIAHIILSAFSLLQASEVDENGYILYCPCMGRFGNQAEHFLGSLAFAKSLNRTLVLPPWVEYRPSSTRSVQVPFDKYFKVEPLTRYHRVMTMEQFMSELAPTIWPKGKRTVYCYSPRQAIMSAGDGGCNAKDGNPFQSFWDTFSVDFDKSEYYGPLSYDLGFSQILSEWNEKFPAQGHPVLAFTGAPAAFPVREVHVELQRYLEWSDQVLSRATKFISDNIPAGQSFLAVHLRIGRDWVNVCKHADDLANSRHHLFASAQCLGYKFEHATRLNVETARELCLPSKDTILSQVREVVEKSGVRVVVVATDSAEDIVDDISGHLADLKTNVIRFEPADDHVDLIILGRADYFIGSCTSTFSAFAVRERRIKGLPVDFWASHLLTVGSDEL